MKTLSVFYHKQPKLDSLSKEQQLRFFEQQFGFAKTMAQDSMTLALFSVFEIKNRKLYHAAGYSDFKKYLQEVWGIKKSTYYDNIPIVEVFHKQLTHEKLAYPDLDRLRQGVKIINMIKDPSKVEEVYIWAKDCNDKGFADNLRELQGKIPHDTCDHSETREKTYLICKTCDKKLGLKEEK